MFGIDINLIAIIVLSAIAAGAVSYGILFGSIEKQKKTESRVSKIKSAETDGAKVKAARDRVQEMSKRRKSVQDTLKEMEKKQQEKSKKSLSIEAKLKQASIPISLKQFYTYSAAAAAFVFFAGFLAGLPIFVVLGAAFVIGAGVPRWFVGFLIKRRQKKFLNEFPSALDIMVRSIRSGLPLNDALRLIAVEGQEPVKTEFRRVIEAQQVGMNIPEACARMGNTMPLQEVNFFAIVIAIQSQAGGNLSEALANLSKVLRERKKMKAKVNALSMEAKASAVIIGILPFAVATLVYLTSPGYISVLVTDPRGHMILLGSGIWMSIGIFVMRNMINFEI
ncbi:type II secretion system F family protein [Rhizobium sp. PAMB 3182]